MDDPKRNCMSMSELNWTNKELMGGKGKFGCVYQTDWSTYDKEGNEVEYIVAVKCPNGVSKKTVLAERDIKADLSHENIVNLVGYAQFNHNQFVALVFDYTEKGTVYDYIWKRREEGGASAGTMMGIAHDIAKGMEYLHANSYVHGDLALRNCIMDADGNVQVGDLGFYEGRFELCYFSDSNMNECKPCPVRWMAPENLPFKYRKRPEMIRKPHTKSYRGDVWAFGVVLYQLWTRGEYPFKGCDNDKKVCKEILDGQTPATWNSRINMRSSMKQLMKRCWKFNPNARPSFSSIVADFEDLMGTDSDSTENEDSEENELSDPDEYDY